ncbi:MAG TPA: riboflavin synthase [Nitrospirae bacterium]|nr:riboflavin synthase [bacterium BMS3Abin06]HDH12881.1 riboflavin synthase [Nitrospirota bacterium]HDZ00489.1 riboflavin synthase [Nitrospirota bacterium]
MFTGLVEISGALSSVKNTGNGIRLSVKPLSGFEVQAGDSISVNGVCLTVTKHNGDISFDVSPETLRSSNLGELRPGDRVNLERALRLSDRLGGHIVTGHVDATGTIRDKKQVGEYTFYSFESPPEILKYIVKKGSVAVDGISLTVVEVDGRSFSVAIIPHTLRATNIGDKSAGDKVNLEVDIIGKYVEKLLGGKESDRGLMELLKEKGFVNE